MLHLQYLKIHVYVMWHLPRFGLVHGWDSSLSRSYTTRSLLWGAWCMRWDISCISRLLSYFFLVRQALTVHLLVCISWCCLSSQNHHRTLRVVNCDSMSGFQHLPSLWNHHFLHRAPKYLHAFELSPPLMSYLKCHRWNTRSRKIEKEHMCQ